jgi:hypothetical protein
VLLDSSFVSALISEADPAHGAATRLYAQLVERYVDQSDRLCALSTVLRTIPRETRRTLLAPVATTHVARQHRSASSRIVGPTPTDVALTLVMLQRERIRTVATTTKAYAGLDVEVLDVGSVAPTTDPPAESESPELDGGDMAADDAVSSRTGSLPVRRSAGGPTRP